METLIEDCDLFAPSSVGDQALYPNGPTDEPDEDEETGPFFDPRFDPTD